VTSFTDEPYTQHQNRYDVISTKTCTPSTSRN